jgi:plasmid maintenance system antidote protein VapI
MKRVVSINAAGLRVGEDHQNAKLTDREVDRMRDLHEAGSTITELARMFEVCKGTVHDIVTYRRRAQVAVSVRVVRVPD